jgi:CHASE3 domain sensor protein
LTVGQSDTELVEKFLRLTRTLKDQERAALSGVSIRTLARWKAGEVSPLADRTRARIEAHVLENVSDADRSAALEVILQVRAKLDELERKLIGEVPRIPHDRFR